MNPLSTTAAIGAKITLAYLPLVPDILLGSELSSRLAFGGAETSIEIRGTIADPEFVFRLGLGEIVRDFNFVFIFEPGDGDGFIKKILGNKPFDSVFGLGLSWSSKHGFQFVGSGGLEVEIPLLDEKKSAESKSPLKVKVLGFGVGGGKFKFNAGTDVSFRLGPIAGEIDDIGASLSLTKKASNEPRGILNDLDFDWGFKFPKGIGLSIDAKAVKGAGYLYIDPENGKYYGAVELKISDKLSLSAIGIVTTKKPDGSEGFSLLIMVNTIFSPGITLPFGFTLNGIGGMIGVNRSMEPDAIRHGVKNGTIKHILFPENIIENIDTIIGSLESIFPIQQKQYTLVSSFY